MSNHSPGAMRAAMAIVDTRPSIRTAEGEKSVGELADLIEDKTRIVDLIDAAERLLHSVETQNDAGDRACDDSSGGVSSQRIDELRNALLAVLDHSVAQSAGASPAGTH